MPPLLSGNGRHRRPRQAPHLLVTAGVTGAGIAIPLLGATGAQAADTATWDRVAECESGGLWSADDDNGYYGGLQLTPDTWEKYGGTTYAKRPDLASRGQQIAVAEKILDAEGPEAWAGCAAGSGLTEDSTAAPDVEQGDGDAESAPPVPPLGSGDIAGLPDHAPLPLPTDESSEAPSDEPSDQPGGEPGGESSESPNTPDSPETSAPSEPTVSADPGEGTGKHRGSPAPEDAAPEDPSPEDPAPGRDARDGEARDRDSGGGAADPQEADRDDRKDRTHRVAPGESLSAIAAEYDVPGGWPELYERNRAAIGSDPDLILPGRELRL